jgi:OOP family OmpA-OmpF porin
LGVKKIYICPQTIFIMKQLRSYFFPVVIVCAVAVLPACKSKKLVQKPAPVVETAPAPAPVAETPAAPAPQPAPAPVVEKPDYNFKNIQFEFNSGSTENRSLPYFG